MLRTFNLSSIPSKLRDALSDENFRVFVNASDDSDEPIELLIMDEIGETWWGDGISAKDVVGFLNEHRERAVNVRMNSPGGLVYDGLVIFNGLSQHSKKVTVTIEGIAFSAASFIAMAGDVVRMHEASDFGIHRAWGGAIGNAKVMRGVAEILDKIDEHLIDIYESKTSASRSQIESWLDGTDDGTVFTAKEAVEQGFADELIPLKSKEDRESKASKAIKRTRASHKNRLSALNRRRHLNLIPKTP